MRNVHILYRIWSSDQLASKHSHPYHNPHHPNIHHPLNNPSNRRSVTTKPPLLSSSVHLQQLASIYARAPISGWPTSSNRSSISFSDRPTNCYRLAAAAAAAAHSAAISSRWTASIRICPRRFSTAITEQRASIAFPRAIRNDIIRKICVGIFVVVVVKEWICQIRL